MEIKKIKIRKLNFFVAWFIFVILSSIILVSAFGVGFIGNKLNMYPGQVLEDTFSLQNTEEGADNLVIEAQIEEGDEYISFIGENEFEIPEGGNAAVPVRISVPGDANIGDVYTFTLLFKVISGLEDVETEGTSIGFAMSQRKTIEIEVISEEEPPEELPAPSEEQIGIGWIILGILIVIIIVVLIYFVVKEKKGTSAAEKSVDKSK